MRSKAPKEKRNQTMTLSDRKYFFVNIFRNNFTKGIVRLNQVSQ